MTARTVAEWIGATPDTPLPPRVKIRLFEAAGGKCADCGIRLGGAIKPEFDHVVPLVLGGANAEGNFQVLCGPCHKTKTAGDVAEKSKTARVKAKHLGIKKASRFPGARSSPWKAKIGGGWERRDGS